MNPDPCEISVLIDTTPGITCSMIPEKSALASAFTFAISVSRSSLKTNSELLISFICDCMLCWFDEI